MFKVRKYLGIPYARQGRTVKGLDCWGLVQMVCGDLGYKFKDIMMDRRITDSDASLDEFKRFKDNWYKVTIPKKGDVVLLQDRKGVIYHIGVCTGPDKFMHCARNIGVVVSRLDPCENRIEGVYRFKKC